MIPEPDYSDSEDQINTEHHQARTTTESSKMSPQPIRVMSCSSVVPELTSSNGDADDSNLILPRKLTNPCVESKEKKDLHRELLFNQKIGKNVLGQKSELKKAMDKFQDDQKKKELESEKHSKRTSFERKLEVQANKIKMQEEQVIQEKSGESEPQSEFQRVHAKVRAKVDSQ